MSRLLHNRFTVNLLNALEVLADPAVTSRMADTKAMAEVKALENFYTILQTEPSRAFYGLKHVLKANEGQAVDTLLVSDNLFRFVGDALDQQNPIPNFSIFILGLRV